MTVTATTTMTTTTTTTTTKMMMTTTTTMTTMADAVGGMATTGLGKGEDTMNKYNNQIDYRRGGGRQW